MPAQETAPPPVAATPGPTREPQLLHVVGRVVDSANTPVAGASLTPWSGPRQTNISDPSGAFDFTVPVTAQDRWFWITVEKPGYETSELVRSVEAAAATSLRLHPITSIQAGDSLRSVVNPDDPACGYHWGYVCRRVRIRSSTTGTLMLEVIAGGTPELGIPVGPVGFPQSLDRRISMRVQAGSEVSVDVAGSWPLGAPAEFTLSTSLTQGN